MNGNGMTIDAAGIVRYATGMDWKTLIADLSARGLTQPQIAALCGCAQTTISELATGKTHEPRYALGVALRQLHARYARRKPVKDNMRSAA